MGVLYILTYNQNTERKFISVLPIAQYDDEFIYKDMDNSVGPCYYHCPKYWISQLPPPTSQYDLDWRRKVNPGYTYDKNQLKMEL
jgi:hypothetical protein